MAGNNNDAVELHPHFIRIETERDVPQWLKIAAEGMHIDDIVNDPKAKIVIAQNLGNYIARILLKKPVYIVAYPRFNQLSVGLCPEADSGTSLPICCRNKDIIRHTALQVMKDKVWVYTSKDAPNVLAAVAEYQNTRGSEEQKEAAHFRSHPILQFFFDLGFDVWSGEGWGPLKEGKIDLSQYRHYELFDLVSFEVFSRKIDVLRDFCREKKYFGFVPHMVLEHPEPDFRMHAIGYD